MTKLRHYDKKGTARFVTFNCYRNLPSLAAQRAKDILIEHLEIARRKHRFKILGFVIMPEHVHLVIHSPHGMKLGLVIREIKSRSARQWFSEWPPPTANVRRVFWQQRCYDHNCRAIEVVREKINYCHADPVKRGLVREPGQWLWSSYNWYRGQVDVPLGVDSIEL